MKLYRLLAVIFGGTVYALCNLFIGHAVSAESIMLAGFVTAWICERGQFG